jgi:cellulose synthase/poly-beta-1,6-N-acetylglucosamine synthase-like glycosyltransferase
MHAERSTTTVNLARRNDFAPSGQAQERPVTEGPELTVVIPTLNERDNIEPLVELLDGVLDAVSWEVSFVDDDSPDGTAERIREISRRDRRVRCLQRIGRRGLTTACIEGALPRLISPLWMPICSTTRRCCRGCWRS